MFDEELAKQIGIAYAVYVSICNAYGKKAVDAQSFKQTATDCIEEIRTAAGLVPEDSVTG